MTKSIQNTHKRINTSLCGELIELNEEYGKIKLDTTEAMIVDETRLIHGGFIFGLADYAAMITINHPNVVLGAAEVKFLKPVKSNQTLIAEGILDKIEGKKHIVKVGVTRDKELVFQGFFTCFTPKTHVLKVESNE